MKENIELMWSEMSISERNEIKDFLREIINKPNEKPFEAKKGDFVIINERICLQLREDLGNKKFIVAEDEMLPVCIIRKANNLEKAVKVGEFQSRGCVCDEEGIWREPKLEEVYCVAESKADFCSVYGVRPDLVHGLADLNTESRRVFIRDGMIINTQEFSDSDNIKIEVSIEKFIELLKKA